MPQPKSLSKKCFARLKAGDSLVFKQVYEDYFGLVHFVARQCGMKGEDVLDVVHDTFLSLYKKIHTINNPEAIKSWLVTTAKNFSVDSLRKTILAEKYNRQQLCEMHAMLNNQDIPVSQSVANYGVLDESERYELELYLLGQLIDQTAHENSDDTFALFYRDGLSAKEIAERNGEPISTVTNRLSRLRIRYREKFIAQLTDLRESYF